jgi:hypothetical protein
MPEIRVTEDQLERLDEVRAELADEVVGKYGHVRPQDAIEYLLDCHTEDPADGAAAAEGAAGTGATVTTGGTTDVALEPGDAGGALDGGASTGDDVDGAGGTGDDADDADDAGTDDADVAGGAGGGSGGMLDAMMNLLSAHDDKWREAGGGDSRYEVDLPDGTTEPARTQDDVRALLFKHYR